MNLKISGIKSASLLGLGMASAFALSVHASECRIENSRDPILRELRAGQIRPDVVGDRLNLFACFQADIKEMFANGWEVKTITIALDDITFTPDGHDQRYLISVPLTKTSPEGPVWQVKKYRYEDLNQVETIKEIPIPAGRGGQNR